MRNAIGLRPALVTLIWAVALLSVSSAQAETPAPGFEVAGFTVPSTLSPEPGSDGIIRMFVYNGGSVPSGEGATLTDTLPAGLEAVAEIPDGENVYTNRNNESPGCSGSPVVTCPLPPMNYGGDPGAVIDIPVRVLPGASSQSDPVNRVSMSGGGVPEGTSTSFPIRYDAEPPGPGFAAFAGWVTNADGTADTQAGSHPYEITTAFAINQSVRRGYDEPEGGEPLALDLAVPPGLVGEPGAVPQCTRAQFDSEGGKECPADSQIGVDLGSVIVGASEGATAPFAVYNLVPPPGVAAQFAFDINHIQVFLTARVRSGGDYGITEHANIPQNGVLFNSTTLWGVPGEASHNPEREGAHCAPAANGCGFAATVKPLLTMPTSCQEAGQFSLEMLGTWQNPEATAPVLSFPSHNNEGTPVGMTGCERLSHFNPSISLGPETSFADTPTGLTATVKVPQGLNPEGLATPGLKETTVTLPEGVVINPGQATGLAACQLAEENIGGPEAEKESEDGPPSCPLASKVGTDEISTPLLAHRLKGNVYILQSNPPNLQLLVAAEGEGVFLKLIGTVHLNEQTGQLTTTFKGTPQDPGTPDAPLNEFVLSFSGGAQAALVTPETCGVYTATADFTPWSTPLVEDALSQSNFTIDSGPGGSGSCTAPLPFAPTMTAGATTDQAGGYTSFTMLLSRGDGQQRMEKLQFNTPEGLLGMIARVPLCGEPQAGTGECPAASQIGHTVAEVGPGPYPFVLPEPGAPPAPIYLTGPYEGAPFGLSIVVPIVAGPFNLGTEVVRAKIEVDPHTSRLTIVTTPFPRTVKGIPTDIREIDAVIDRPEFMFNPTSCAPMSFSGTAYSFEGATAPLASHFQVGSCQALKFQPDFKVTTSGKTSRANGANLTVKIVYPTGNLGSNQASSQSNIQSVKVDLPKQLPSRLTTLQKACPAAVFNANSANCPPDSIVGHARALTPVLPVPIEGPAYFVSHAGEEFPNLIIVFQGDNVTIDLVGSTFISKAGITSSTFKQVPDVPIGLFELNLPQGKYSALAANTNLCKATLTMPTAFTAQNGAVIHKTTPVSVTGCVKHKAKKAKAKKSNKRKKK